MPAKKSQAGQSLFSETRLRPARFGCVQAGIGETQQLLRRRAGAGACAGDAESEEIRLSISSRGMAEFEADWRMRSATENCAIGIGARQEWPEFLAAVEDDAVLDPKERFTWSVLATALRQASPAWW